MWAIVPLKSPESAKSRLREALDDDLRRALYFAMAGHVLRTLRATAGIDGVAVITASAEVAARAAALDARVVMQGADGGTAQACRHALAQLEPDVRSVLMISGDLPLLTSAALAPLLALDGIAQTVAIVPDRHRRGTNALLCVPPQAIEPAFGVDSFRRHVARAVESELDLHIVESAQIALDIDSPDDLEALRRQPQQVPCGALRALLERLPELQP